jgi:hypothetical protein
MFHIDPPPPPQLRHLRLFGSTYHQYFHAHTDINHTETKSIQFYIDLWINFYIIQSLQFPLLAVFFQLLFSLFRANLTP